MKIAFVVQPDWLSRHFGVRNLFVALYKALRINGHDADFVFFKIRRTQNLWYRVFIDDNALQQHISQTLEIKGKDYNKVSIQGAYQIPDHCTQYLGTNINNIFDAVIVTNPWLINNSINIECFAKILICYDIGANKLALSDKNVLGLVWGFEHNDGCRYCLKNNYHFLSISEKTDKEIVRMYKPEKHSFLPPVLPQSFFNVSYDIFTQKENAVVLAAPFDPRKGLLKMPNILNRLKEEIDTLYIFGRPRCGQELYYDFYKKIQIRNIIHYADITNDDLIKLYKKCKFLFFPSIEEGLGIPILEAQVCGCRVVTTNAEPMSTLTLSGGYLLCGSDEEDSNTIKTVLHETSFDYADLSHRAQEAFSIDRVYEHLSILLTPMDRKRSD